MKSSGLQTTSAAVSNVAAAAAAGRAPDDAETVAFEALLVPALCRPVSAALGPLGGVFGDVIARTLVERPSGDSS